MMKKFLALLLALGLMAALAACDKLPSESSDPAPATSGAPVESTEPAPEDNSGEVITPTDGSADGFIGDTLRTAFFDYTVNSAYTCAEFGGYTPAEGNRLLVVNLTVYNPTIQTQPMFDTDFQLGWGTPDEEGYDEMYGYPLETETPLCEDQFPVEYELGIQETRTGTLVYEVPADYKDFSVSYWEYYSDGSTGDMFFVYFTAEEQ